MPAVQRIKQLQKKAYAGPSGAKRKNFCVSYRETLKLIRAETEKKFSADITRTGDKISCEKGCSYCCLQHISAPAAHAIAVVDFLYSNNSVLTHFLESYEPWEQKAGELSAEIDKAYNSAIGSENTSNSRALGLALSRSFLNQKIPCPFLVNSACSIYEVRPIACSAHQAVTPPEWCDPAQSHEVRTYEIIPNREYLQALVSLAPTHLSVYYASLPLMVYRLLTEKYSVIMEEIERHFAGA